MTRRNIGGGFHLSQFAPVDAVSAGNGDTLVIDNETRKCTTMKELRAEIMDGEWDDSHEAEAVHGREHISLAVHHAKEAFWFYWDLFIDYMIGFCTKVGNVRLGKLPEMFRPSFTKAKKFVQDMRWSVLPRETRIGIKVLFFLLSTLVLITAGFIIENLTNGTVSVP